VAIAAVTTASRRRCRVPPGRNRAANKGTAITVTALSFANAPAANATDAPERAQQGSAVTDCGQELGSTDDPRDSFAVDRQHAEERAGPQRRGRDCAELDGNEKHEPTHDSVQYEVQRMPGIHVHSCQVPLSCEGPCRERAVARGIGAAGAPPRKTREQAQRGGAGMNVFVENDRVEVVGDELATQRRRIDSARQRNESR
jgi:hypothetical protein